MKTTKQMLFEPHSFEAMFPNQDLNQTINTEAVNLLEVLSSELILDAIVPTQEID